MRNFHCLLVSVFLLISEGLHAQTMETLGKIPDPTGIPISDVGIRIKSCTTAVGAKSDAAGVLAKAGAAYGNSSINGEEMNYNPSATLKRP